MQEDINIIDNYRDLPIGDYQDILAICKDKDLEELDRSVKVMSILTRQTEDTLLNLPIHQFSSLCGKMEFLWKGLPTSASRIAKTYEVGKFTLVPVMDMRKITTAQYIDFQSFHQAGMEEHYVEILSCLLVPKGKKYNQDYDILEVQEAIRRDLNVHDATSLYAFFMVSSRDLMRDTLISSLGEVKRIKDKTKRKELEMKIREQLTILEKSGGGSPM